MTPQLNEGFPLQEGSLKRLLGNPNNWSGEWSPRLDRGWSVSRKIRSEMSFDRLRFFRRTQKAGGPLSQDAGDLVVIFLSYELVETRFGVEKNGLEGKLGAIVWVEAEFGNSSARKGSESGGECGGGYGETGLLEKFAAIGVGEISRIDRVLFSGQWKSPRALWLRS